MSVETDYTEANPVPSAKVLVGGEDREVHSYLEMALKCLGYQVEPMQDGEDVIDHLRSSEADLSAILLSLNSARPDSLENLRLVKEVAPGIPVIIVSPVNAPLAVVNAIKSGAADFLSKPVLLDDLRETLARTMAAHEHAEEVHKFSRIASGPFIASNPAMRKIDQLVAQIGWSEAPVLIQGETGSGKEVIARQIHAKSPRADKAFVKLNCAALPSELVESELFGYERGAFTGAYQKKAGMFEVADGGTILLDEIGDMDFRLQAKLLQVLQDQEFQRIGGKAPIKVDVRVMAATHCDLEHCIGERTFREDLYYRLSVINVQLPPLRERPEDIIPLAEFLLTKHAPPGGAGVLLSSRLKHAMVAHRWPGNVRELENTVRRLLVLRNSDAIASELLAKSAAKGHRASSVEARDTIKPTASPAPILKQVIRAKHRAETEAILAALQATRWNRKQAAALLEIDYKALLYKMKKLGVEEQPLSDVPEPFPQLKAAAAGANSR